MSNKVITLDVREELRLGREPFSLIMRTVQQLQPEESFRLVAPFEPVPLYGIMANNGFGHTATATPEGDYEILFERKPDAGQTSRPITFPEAPPCRSKVGEVDARGLEPPQPLVKILEAVENLAAGMELRARTDRRPMHLLAQLEERGLTSTCQEQADGSYLTTIRRP